jgi:hypothetical protein
MKNADIKFSAHDTFLEQLVFEGIIRPVVSEGIIRPVVCDFDTDMVY